MNYAVKILIVSIPGAFAVPGVAQQIPSSAIVDALSIERTGPVVRSMDAAQKRGIIVSGALSDSMDLPSLNLVINFDVNSARLSNDGMLIVRNLAKALLDPKFHGMRFQIGGHTDGSGDYTTNQSLSERRARAIVEHLVNFYEIDPARLVAIGYGQSRPLDPSNPMNPLNRRVEIVNLAPLS